MNTASAPTDRAARAGSLGCLFAVGALLCAAPRLAVAGDGAMPAGPASAIETLWLAERLTDQARQRNDALGLIMAARLKLLHPGLEVQRVPLRSAGKARPATLKPALHPRSAEALLARARELAKDRPDLLALADDVARERARGTGDGPKSHSRVAPALATDVYRDTFRAAELATVLISGDGESNLDLYVFDAAGKRICASETLEDVEVCRWQPAAGGSYTIQVVNRGRADNLYLMRSN